MSIIYQIIVRCTIISVDRDTGRFYDLVFGELKRGKGYGIGTEYSLLMELRRVSMF